MAIIDDPQIQFLRNYMQDPQKATTPQPMPPPVPPASTSPFQDKAVNEVKGTISAGQTLGQQLLGDTRPATISNPYSQQWNDYLTLLKSRVNGMTPQELQTEQEQGLAGINQQMSNNQERLAGIAGSQGLSGGVSAGLQAKALNQAQQDRASLQRQLILDNIAQKNAATQAYGGALDQLTGIDLGVNQFNAGAQNSLNMLKVGLPIQVAGLIQGQQAQDTTTKNNTDALSIAKDYIKAQGNSGAGTNQQPVSAAAQAALRTINPQTQNAVTSVTPTTPPVGTRSQPAISSNAPKKLDTNGDAQQFTDGDGTVWRRADALNNGAVQGVNADDYSNAYVTPDTGVKYVDVSSLDPSSKSAKLINSAEHSGKLCGPSGACYVVTAARDAGLVDMGFLQHVTAKCPTKRKNVAAYHLWGPRFAALVSRSAFIRQFTKAFLPDTVGYMMGRKLTLKGFIGYFGVYAPLSLVSRAWLKFRKSETLHG